MEQAIREINSIMQKEQWNAAISMIYNALGTNAQESELYFMLAQCKEMLGEWQQAALSYQNALFWSKGEDFEIIKECYLGFLENCPVVLPNVSIVLVTYNQLEYTKLCVESIRYNNLFGTYEIIIVDNQSTDGTREWLLEQDDIKVILNDKNSGFPTACNQGAEIAAHGNDIFLLNNDTIVMANSIYNLRMALYEKENIGVTGACSNSVSNAQQIEEEYSNIEEYARYAIQNNYYSVNRHEKRLKLVGFAMMFRRKVWEDVDGLDERYGIGNCEDDDISLKILSHGFLLVFCKDSFIYHFGSQSFKQIGDRYKKILAENKLKFQEKWGIQQGYFALTRYDILSLLEMGDENLNVLEVGCGFGATLLEIKNRNKNARVFGVEINQKVTEIASKYLNILQGDIQVMDNPFDVEFDCIILGDVLEHLYNPKQIIIKLKKWMKPEGIFLICVPNIAHISVVMDLLHGKFTYEDAGILDRTHLRFFTAEELANMVEECGLEIEEFMQKTSVGSEEEKIYIERLCGIDPSISKQELSAYQYIIRATVRS